MKGPEGRIMRRRLGGKKEDVTDVGENCIMMTFLIFTNH